MAPHIHNGKIVREITLTLALNTQTSIGQLRAQHRRIAMQIVVDGLADVFPSVSIPPAQHLTPRLSLRIATGAEQFKRRGDPDRRGSLAIAAADFSFDREPASVHHVGPK